MGKRQYLFGVYVGRFQPFHNAHLELVLEALESVKKLIIIVGSAKNARTIKNPFTFDERVKMITEALIAAGVDKNRFIIKGVQDYFYNEQMWLNDIQSTVDKIAKGSQDIALMGHIKDDSSYYLRSFPHWKFVATNVKSDINATDVRVRYFGDDVFRVPLKDMVPAKVFNFLLEAKYDTRNEEYSSEYLALKTEYDYIKAYKKEQEAYPWPIIFVTVDAVVIRSGHVLVIKRGGELGKGLYALPGGHLNPDETIFKATIRELREETSIKLLDAILEDAAQETTVFDYPARSLRGRTITHATFFNLGKGQLPTIKAADDAAEAFWMPIHEALAKPELFFEDHWHLLYHFTMRY